MKRYDVAAYPTMMIALLQSTRVFFSGAECLVAARWRVGDKPSACSFSTRSSSVIHVPNPAGKLQCAGLLNLGLYRVAAAWQHALSSCITQAIATSRAHSEVQALK